MQVFTDPHLHAEAPRWFRGNPDAVNLPGIHSTNPDLRAVLQTRDVRELRIDVNRTVEEHTAVANKEEPNAEEEHPPNHECAHRSGVSRIHARIIPRGRMS